jgi:nucleoside-diphosphate-sugar epimerase
MNLVIAGASGYVATELIRQALIDPRFTKVIALARREVKAPTDLGPEANTSKFQSVVIKNYDIESYTDEVKKQLAGADACIWTVAVTPGKAQLYAWEDVVKVCRDSALIGLEKVIEARGEEHGEKPLRFVYMSGNNGERDQSKSPLLLKQMCLMRVRHSFLVINLNTQLYLTITARAKPRRLSLSLQPSMQVRSRRAARNLG